MRLPLLLAACLALPALAGCTTTPTGDPEVFGVSSGGTIRPDTIRQEGSSTVLPLAEVWAAEFGTARGVRITVGGGGSGRGASGLCAGELDLGDMSRAMRDSEKETCRANGVEPVEWKIAFDGISVVVSNDNTFLQDLTVDDLAQIFRSEDPARTWDEVDPAFPATTIRLCYPDSDSGTYEYFNEEVLGKGNEPRTGSGVQQSSDDNVIVTCVRSDPNAIGYFGYAYAIENEDKVRTLAIGGVAPTPTTIAQGSYHPLSRPIYIYTDGVPAGLLGDYMYYIYHPEGGQALVLEVGYVALDRGTRDAMLAQLGRS